MKIRMLKDEKWTDTDGNEHRAFVVRCMRRASKYRTSTYGILDVGRNLFVLSFGEGGTKEQMTALLNKATYQRYLDWCNTVAEGMSRR
jgi:hypothetical protein